ncbi:terminase small subunit [Chitinophaga cymbidii]|uniref:DNA-packaging protein n=1 Tax=Chitinophaga cymbidii TaxID=1096750 RepID=A0A512RIM9_9BACT|nr:terminase small subunit [Chitinophaga cymbidii]GEP95556.1 hypothetical protein CCY01nite_18160 [Chitinophaga cymbidii]
MARPKGTYKFTVEQIETAWTEYKQKCDDFCVWEVSAGKKIKVPNPQIYTLESFLIYLGMDEDTFDRYKGIARFSRTVTRIRAEVFACKKTAMVNGYGNVQGIMFDMRANYKITDKQDLDVNLAATITQVVPKVINTGVPLASSEKDIQE